MSTSFTRLRFLAAAALLFLAAPRLSLAGSAAWSSNPSSGDWNTAANWTPNTVPNSTTDVATFGASDQTSLSITTESIVLDSVVFNSVAPAYTLTIQIYNLTFEGAGIVNNSGAVQTIVTPTVDNNDADLFFYNSASAGNMISFSTVGGFIEFFDSSSAGSATFGLTSGSLQGFMFFNDDSTAGNATINASGGAFIAFLDSSTGGNATLNLSTAAFVSFAGSNNAEHMTGSCIGGNQQYDSEIEFEGYSSAGEGSFTAVGGSTSGEQGGFILFDNTATADNATFVINGGTDAGLSGTTLVFTDVTTAANATITANGGAGGSEGGVIFFEKKSKGGTASITLTGNAELDISLHNTPGVTIGSLAGQGSVFLGANRLTIGSNNRSTLFSGVIQDGGSSGGAGGSLSKTGSGILALSRANSYTGGTTVSAGVLRVANKNGSATGSGLVSVNGGTLGGNGTIAGATTVGTGSGSGASLAPALGKKQPQTLTLQSTLALNSDATYTCTFKARRAEAHTDLVVAHGLTINGATLNLAGQIQGSLSPGLTLTVISNTSATKINGTFTNLPDGALISVNGATFQASYHGGDGNDLTLTAQ